MVSDFSSDSSRDYAESSSSSEVSVGNDWTFRTRKRIAMVWSSDSEDEPVEKHRRLVGESGSSSVRSSVTEGSAPASCSPDSPAKGSRGESLVVEDVPNVESVSPPSARPTMPDGEFLILHAHGVHLVVDLSDQTGLPLMLSRLEAILHDMVSVG